MPNLQGMPGRSINGLTRTLQGFGGGARIYFFKVATGPVTGIYDGPSYATTSSVFTEYLDGVIDPSSMHVADNRIYIMNEGTSQILVYNRSFDSLFTFGSNGTGDGEFILLTDAFVDSSAIYALDGSLGKVQIFDLSGNYVSGFSAPGDGTDEILVPLNILVVGGIIYVTDSYDGSVSFHGVKMYELDGDYVGQFGTIGTGDGEFTQIGTGAMTYADGNIYIANTSGIPGEKFIQVFDTSGVFQFKYQDEGSGDGQLDRISGISAYGGQIYVLDPENERISIFDLGMNWIRSIDISGLTISSDEVVIIFVG